MNIMEPKVVPLSASRRPETIDLNVGSLQLFDVEDPLQLEHGAALEDVTIAYESYGRLNEEGTNAILVCHALTGSAHVCDHAPVCCNVAAAGQAGWWEEIIGPGKPLDPRKYFVVCSNILGSCYGTTGPTSLDPRTGTPYGARFPQLTVRDVVRVQHRLLARLGVKRLVTVIGGSLGGMQVLEWSLLYPDMVESIVPISTAARHSPWAIALNEASRLAIMSDPNWQGGHYTEPPRRGLALARIIATISYRSNKDFNWKFGRAPADEGRAFEDLFAGIDSSYQIEQYLRYQGKKLVQRFDANSYITITRMMDSQDVTRGRGTLPEALGRIQARTLCIGIDSDVLYPADEQKEIASHIVGATYEEIQSERGHDAFLIEHRQLCEILDRFLAGSVGALGARCGTCLSSETNFAS
jgi:homoserine O-acetyltransferase